MQSHAVLRAEIEHFKVKELSTHGNHATSAVKSIIKSRPIEQPSSTNSRIERVAPSARILARRTTAADTAKPTAPAYQSAQSARPAESTTSSDATTIAIAVKHRGDAEPDAPAHFTDGRVSARLSKRALKRLRCNKHAEPKLCSAAGVHTLRTCTLSLGPFHRTACAGKQA